MDSKEKKITSKKKTTKKPIKKEIEKKEVTKKVAKKIEQPKIEEKKVIKKVVKKVEKPEVEKKKTSTIKKKIITQKKVVKKEEPKVYDKDIKDEKVVEAKVDQELIKARTTRQNIEAVILSFLFLIVLLLLLNKTFVKTTYKTDKLDIDIPRFMYYVSDDGNTAVFKTLRKSTNVREFFDEYLEEYTYYDCTEKGYYNPETMTFIKSITVEKGFAVKTVKIEYTIKLISDICS